MKRHVSPFSPSMLLLPLTLVGCVTDPAGSEPTDLPQLTATPSQPGTTETPESSPLPELSPTPEPSAEPLPLENPLVPFPVEATITTVAGSGSYGENCEDPNLCMDNRVDYGSELLNIQVFTLSGGYAGDGGPATQALLNWPTGVAIAPDGGLAIADMENSLVRCVSPEGIITTCAGKLGGEAYQEDLPATSVYLPGPAGLTFDGAGNLYIIDPWACLLSQVSPAGVLMRAAGSEADCGYNGDGLAARDTLLDSSTGVLLDRQGDLLIADYWNNRIRRIDHSTHLVSTVAGGGGRGTDEGVPATESGLDYPGGIAVDASNNLYITDNFHHRIRKVSAETGIITTLAGTGIPGFSGDGGPALSANLYFPTGLAVDGQGNVFFTDTLNNLVRVITPAGTIYTAAGNGLTTADRMGTFSGDGGPATQAGLDNPYDVEVDASGNLLIVDTNNNRIRKVTFSR